MKKLKTGCVLMAAGDARRFGENKLRAVFEGKSLIERALEAVPAEALYRTAVVSQYDDVLALAAQYGFCAVLNDRPEEGVSRTIALGLDALYDADAAMFMVADQPCLTKSSVRAEVEFFQKNSRHIVAMGYGKRRGNPAIFPSAFFAQLRELQGDAGGSLVICRNENRLKLYQIENELELMDADNAQELERIREASARGK